MQPATDDAVLGDFDDAVFDDGGRATRFVRRGKDFVVETEDAEGEMRNFTVRYAFGVHPLQQVLLATAPGRLQAFSIAWDVDGGRWFHLQPGVDSGAALHWTAPAYNWNAMCADCHSTGVRKNYDAENDSYATAYAEVNVGCEACHGPGSHHATAPMPGYGSAAGEVDACAPCHSLRTQIAEGFVPGRPLLDYYRPAVVSPPSYHADGQILEEVYVYGSFLQSRMHARGVRCVDCHEPHSGALRRPGNAVCTQCHSADPRREFPMATKKTYDDRSHHQHAEGRCVDCHMPSRTYMGVDERHDHGFRIPRPDLSAAYGVPNACNGCHRDESAAWIEAALVRWRGGEGDRQAVGTADVLALAATGRFESEATLADAAMNPALPGIVRRAALSALAGYEGVASRNALAGGLRDADPLVRLGALDGMVRQPPPKQAVLRLAADPVLAVRLAAAPAAARLLRGRLASDERAAVDAIVGEYIRAASLHMDRAEGHAAVAIIHTEAGDYAKAEASLRRALGADPSWLPALVNLADLLRAAGRDRQGGEYLARAAALDPPAGDAAYAYALWLVRQGRRSRALDQFRRAAQLDSQSLRNHYVYAAALRDAGADAEASDVLEQAIRRFGRHRILVEALAASAPGPEER